MSLRLLAAYAATGLVLLLSGCDGAGVSGLVDEGANRDAAGQRLGSISDCATLGGYEICLTPSTEGAGTTTFVYTVTPAGATEHLRHLIFGYDQTCSPALQVVVSDPAGAAPTNDEATGLIGIFYDSQQRKNQTVSYSITFAGSVPTGIARAGVVIGGTASTATLLGPACEPIKYAITGSVFVESDDPTDEKYGTREVQELGIEKVIVRLTDVSGNAVLDGDGLPYEAETDASGAYTFSEVVGGTYRVVIPALTGPENDAYFNEMLYREEGGARLYMFSHQAPANQGGLAAVEVTVGPDEHVDLGFLPDAESVVAALGGALKTKNELPFSDFLPLVAGLSTPSQNDPKALYARQAGDYTVSFAGRHVDRTLGKTTYYYDLSRRGGPGVNVSNITFETGGCAPVSFQPSTGVQVISDPITGDNSLRFDAGVRKIQRYAITYNGEPDPGVIDVALKLGSDVLSMRMPGACAEALGSSSMLSDALALIFSDGKPGDEYLFLADPLSVEGHASEVQAAIALLSILNPVEFGATDLKQRLLASEIIFLMGLGTDFPSFDETLFQFVEPIIQLESQIQSSGKVYGIQAGTGGSRAGGSVLGGYLST